MIKDNIDVQGWILLGILLILLGIMGYVDNKEMEDEGTIPMHRLQD